MLSVSIGTWASTSVTIGTNSQVEYNYNSNESWNCWANFTIASGETTAFYTWLTGGSNNATNVLACPPTSIQFKGEQSEISLGTGSLTLTGGTGEWANFERPSATINSNSADELSTWLSDATNGTVNTFILNTIDRNKVTISGTNPVFTFGSSSSTVTLQTIDSKLVGVLDLKGTDALSDWTGTTIGSGAFFSNLTYRISINNDGTSYIDLGTNSATVHSNAEDDFATWIANSGNSDLLAGLGVNSYAFEGAAKFETSGADNYIVLNGTTATVTSADALTSLDTWMTNHTTYLSDVNTYNMSSEVTTYLTNTSPYITTTVDNDKKMVVTSSTVTVTKDIADFNSWRNTTNGKKILKGKTVEYVDCALKDANNCCTITLSNDGLTATVHATTAGHFNALYDDNKDLFNTGTRFKFDNESMLNKEDLLCIMQGTKYYIDLYDITNGESTPMKIDDWTTADDNANTNNIDMILEAAVNDMVNNGFQARGILMPKNTGSGTSKMEKKNSNNLPTFTEYATYYRATSKTSAIYVYDMNTHHNSGEPVTIAQANFETTAAHLLDHIALSDLEILIVGTNNANRINLRNKITANIMTEIQTTRDDMVQSGRGPADIYVKSKTAGDLKVATEATNIDLTECNRLVVEGPVKATDITAVNNFTHAKALILKDATGLTASDFSELTNTTVEYIVLPAGWSKTDVSASTFPAAMTGLKAVVSSSNTNLVGYVKEAGTLAAARYYATGGSAPDGVYTTVYAPTITGLTNVTLNGTLNAADIAANVTSSWSITSEGRWGTGGGAQVLSYGLSGETNVNTFDLAGATFVDNDDMNFSKAGLSSLVNVTLPTASNMTKIPALCFENIPGIEEICVPSNYTVFGQECFKLTGLKHLTTTDPTTHAVIDNGPLTYTIGSTVTSVETGAFLAYKHITDVYVMATTAPKCAKDAFDIGSYVSNNSFAGVQSHPFGRDKYDNPGDQGTMCVLHFPSTVTTAEAKKYTDLTREYSLADETGNLDGDGNPIMWPSQSEYLRSYDQAVNHVTWDAWDKTRDNQNAIQYGTYNTETPGLVLSGKESCTFDADYTGWHQFALCASWASNIVEPTTSTVKYEALSWYTICLPYNLTKAQVVKYLGIPASETGGINEVHNQLTEGTDITENRLPDIRTMVGVVRTKKQGDTQNKITINLSENLATQANDINVGLRSATYTTPRTVQAGMDDNDDNKIYMHAGHPYFIKAYLPKTIKDNMGSLSIGAITLMRIMRSPDAATITSQIDNQISVRVATQINTETGEPTVYKESNDLVNHPVQIQVQAQYVNDGTTYFANVNDTEDTEGETLDDNDFIYSLQGQYWEQQVPLGCYYLSKGKFYRATAAQTGSNEWSKYLWKPYVCVIAPKAGKDVTLPIYRGEGIGYSRGYSEIFKGSDDAFEDTSWARTTYELVFDDAIVEVGEDGNETTAIDELDGVKIAPVAGKIFNMAGQYVGDSVEGLTKGLYIINGKKVVIK